MKVLNFLNNVAVLLAGALCAQVIFFHADQFFGSPSVTALVAAALTLSWAVISAVSALMPVMNAQPGSMTYDEMSLYAGAYYMPCTAALSLGLTLCIVYWQGVSSGDLLLLAALVALFGAGIALMGAGSDVQWRLLKPLGKAETTEFD